MLYVANVENLGKLNFNDIYVYSCAQQQLIILRIIDLCFLNMITQSSKWYLICHLLNDSHYCRYFSPGPPVFSNNKTDRHDITEILLNVAINTIKQTKNHPFGFSSVEWYIHCFQLFSDVFSNSINISKTNNHLSPHLSEHIK